jgi:DUF1365 family protein
MQRRTLSVLTKVGLRYFAKHRKVRGHTQIHFERHGDYTHTNSALRYCRQLTDANVTMMIFKHPVQTFWRNKQSVVAL